jgi:hypothetical protein
MIAHMFRDRDWESDDAPNVKMFVEHENQDAWSAADSPGDAVQPVQYAKHFGKSMPLEQFQDQRTRAALEQYVVGALLWGLSNPDRFAAWYASERENPRLARAREAGLDVGLPPLPDFLAYSEQIVRDYERDIDPLPSIPARLLADATALGWRIAD